MRLTDLKPYFVRRIDDHHFKVEKKMARADGVEFLCPKCFVANAHSSVGTHSVLCWGPSVPQTTSPTPGRWEMLGTGLEDLTLRASSSSVQVIGGCAAHFYITNGEIVNA